MYSNEKLVRSILGDRVYEALNKSIVKLNTKSVVDISELHAALKIAPKSVVAFLMKETEDMKKDGAKEIKLPWDGNATMLLNKLDTDTYKGHISKDGRIVHEFDLCSIPQLAAHILSFFELYDEVPEQGEPKEESKQEHEDIEKIKHQLQTLESKLNALIMLAAGPSQEPVQKSQKDKLTKAITALKKAGLAPTMPKPPKPGVHSGSQQGITQAGFHSPKTTESDSSVGRQKTKEKMNPHLKTGDKLATQSGLPQPAKQPKQPKMSMALKSESMSSKCLDCGEPDFINGKFARCACFKAMSMPDIKKSENGLTFYFGSDWDSDNKIALWHSLRKVRRG